MDKKKTHKKAEKNPRLEEKDDKKDKSEETVSNGLPEDIDFKKFLGCGG